jgi:ubiquinone/menaquinone biosynthesis C-methylase UbiE
MAEVIDLEDPGELNRATWSQHDVLRWFAKYEGWSDPGEAAAIELLRDEFAGQPILDIGVGGGRTTPLLRAISLDYTAIDFSSEMVGICQRKYPDVRALFGDARDLSAFADDSFALVVFSWNGIDAVDHSDRQTILSEVRRVLRPGGAFVFSTHNKLGPGFGERPWTVRINDLAHPRHLLQLAVWSGRNVKNYRANRHMCSDHGSWALMTAAAHNFGIVIHYTTLQAELAELRQAGFTSEPVVFESTRGQRVTTTSDTSRSWWFHVVVRT